MSRKNTRGGRHNQRGGIRRTPRHGGADADRSSRNSYTQRRRQMNHAGCRRDERLRAPDVTLLVVGSEVMPQAADVRRGA